MRAHHDAGSFKKAVERREFPDYHKVVSRPMHLAELTRLVYSLHYSSVEMFLEDCRCGWCCWCCW
jgi:hypothetical protein